MRGVSPGVSLETVLYPMYLMYLLSIASAPWNVKYTLFRENYTNYTAQCRKSRQLAREITLRFYINFEIDYITKQKIFFLLYFFSFMDNEFLELSKKLYYEMLKVVELIFAQVHT